MTGWESCLVGWWGVLSGYVELCPTSKGRPLDLLLLHSYWAEHPLQREGQVGKRLSQLLLNNP